MTIPFIDPLRPPSGPNVYPSVSAQIADMLIVGRNAQRQGWTELAELQVQAIATLAREYVKARPAASGGDLLPASPAMKDGAAGIV